MIGDADHGANMARGMTAVAAKLDSEIAANIAELFKIGRHDARDERRRRERPAVRHVLPAVRDERRSGDDARRGRSWRRAARRAGGNRRARQGGARRQDDVRRARRLPSTRGTRPSPPGGPRPTRRRGPRRRRGRAATRRSRSWRARGARATSASAAPATSTRARRRPRCFCSPWPTVSGADVIGIVVVSHSPALARCRGRSGARDGRRVAPRDPGRRRRRGRCDGDGCRRHRRAIDEVACPTACWCVMDLGSAILSAGHGAGVLARRRAGAAERRARSSRGSSPPWSWPAPAARSTRSTPRRAAHSAARPRSSKAPERAAPRRRLEHDSGSLSPPPRRSRSRRSSRNPSGLHARPAAVFVKTVGRYDADVRVTELGSGKAPPRERA